MNSKYITRYRKALFEEIEEGYGVPSDLSDELQRLCDKLISSLKKDFEKHPASMGPYNVGKVALRECLLLQERSMKAATLYNNASAKERGDVLAVFYTIDEAVGSLLTLLLDNWQEAERPEKYQFPIEWNVAKPLAELIRDYARFTTHYTSMKDRLKAAKPGATMPAVGAAEVEPKATLPAGLGPEPDIESIGEYLSDKCPITLCDKAAKKIGLSVGSGADTFSDLRIHALAEALKETRSLQITPIGINNFRPVLARHYGVSDYNPKYRPQHGKGTGPSQRIEKWDDAFNSARSFLTNHYEQERRKK